MAKEGRGLAMASLPEFPHLGKGVPASKEIIQLQLELVLGSKALDVAAGQSPLKMLQ